MSLLLTAALLPIIGLCAFIYFKDKNKEPKGLLALIFFLGLLSVIPVVVCELVFEFIFPMVENANFIVVFLEVLFGIAIYEELFKWLITKFIGYNNKEFDEVYDILVYSVFASLGFACFENILYVLQNGLGNAFMRALLAVPGHTCFAIAMGYFMSRAKVAQMNGNKIIYVRNMILSYIAPVVLHTFYDALLLYSGEVTTVVDLYVSLIPFLIFYIIMVIVCFITVDKTARVQQKITNNLNNGKLYRNDQGYLAYNYPTTPAPAVGIVPTTTAQNAVASVPTTTVQNAVASIPTTAVQSAVITDTIPNTNPVSAFQDEKVTVPAVSPNGHTFHFCPVCGKPSDGLNFCGRCGFKLK